MTVAKIYFSICFWSSWYFNPTYSILHSYLMYFSYLFLFTILAGKDLFQYISGHLFFPSNCIILETLKDASCVFPYVVGKHRARWKKEMGQPWSPVSTGARPLSDQPSLLSSFWGWMFSHTNHTLSKNLTAPVCVRDPTEMRHMVEFRAFRSTPEQVHKNFQPIARIPLTTSSGLPV